MFMQYFDKGSRGLIYINPEREYIIKIGKENKILNEAKWLKKLNSYNIGPELIKTDKNYVIIEYINGKKILDYFQEADKEQILVIIRDILLQCRILDKLKINKLEMHHPLKHIIINSKNKPILIDFERCHFTKRTKNITQFCQFLTSNKVRKIFLKKELIFNKYEIIKRIKIYKNKQNESNFLKLLSMLCQ